MCIMMNSPYPCGHCYECLSRKRSDWSLRLQEQKKFTNVAYHAILTYNNENLPRTSNGLPNVSKRDCQLFLKRLRHVFPDRKLSYFLVSEYGTRTQRPHYHIILFNVPNLPNDLMVDILQSNWQNGHVRRRSSYVVNDAQLHYILKDIYNWLDPLVLYKQRQSQALYNHPRLMKNFEEMYKDYFNYYDSIKSKFDSDTIEQKLKDFDDRDQNFRLMSKGLGKSWISSTDILTLEQQRDVVKWLKPRYKISIHKDGSKHLLVAGFKNLKYDVVNDTWILPPEVLATRDFVEVVQAFKDYGKHKTTYKTNRYAMPAYWRNKVFIPEFRFLLNLITSKKAYERRQNYMKQYGDYDLSHVVPMFIEQNRELWRKRYNSHKDKLYHNEFDFYLND